MHLTHRGEKLLIGNYSKTQNGYYYKKLIEFD